jgi:Mg2+ and Co2+ transporter CorA
MRKQLRAMEKLQGFIDNESIKWITKKVKKLFTSIFLRIEGVSRFSDSIYKACAELLRIYDAKITSETNMVVTRLTAITLIVGMWTVVAGLYGMNVWLPGGDDPYSFYIIIGILVVLTVVLLIFFVFKKII